MLYYLLSLEPKIDVNPVDVTGGTPLDDAIRHGQEVCETMLRSAGGLTKDDPKLLETQQQREISKKEQDRLIRWPQVLAAAEKSKEMAFFTKFDSIMQTYRDDDPDTGDDNRDGFSYVENEEEFIEEHADDEEDTETCSFLQRLKRFDDFLQRLTCALAENTRFLLEQACSEDYVARLRDCHSEVEDAAEQTVGKPPATGVAASMSFCGRLRADANEDAQPMAAPDVVGHLAVQCIRAEGLPKMDFLTGKADPYLVVRVDGAARSEQSTSCKKATLHPVWEETLHFDKVAASSQLHVELFDQEYLGKDRTMGSFAIPVSRIATNTQTTFDLHGQLPDGKGPAQGRVCMSFLFTPSLPSHPPGPAPLVSAPTRQSSGPPQRHLFSVKGMNKGGAGLKRLRLTVISVEHLPSTSFGNNTDTGAGGWSGRLVVEWQGQSYSTAARRSESLSSLEWNETCSFQAPEADEKRELGHVHFRLLIQSSPQGVNHESSLSSLVGTASISEHLIRELGQSDEPEQEPGVTLPGASARPPERAHAKGGWRERHLSIPILSASGTYLTSDDSQICSIRVRMQAEFSQVASMPQRAPVSGPEQSPGSPHLAPSLPQERAFDSLEEVAALMQQLTVHLAALRKTVVQLPESAPALYKVLCMAYEKQRQEFLNGLLRNAFLARHVSEMMRKLRVSERKNPPL